MLLVFLVAVIGFSGANCCLQTSEKDIKLELGEHKVLDASVYHLLGNGSIKTIDLIPEHEKIITITTTSAKSEKLEIRITALSPGKSEVSVVCGANNNKNETEELFMLVQVHHSRVLDILSTIFGWLYFLSWSTCFYPQLYENFKTKSVVGLNFDTVLFGLVGYIMYNIFNVVMFYSPLIKKQYSLRYPHGIAPVLINDLVFSMHGVLVTSATSYQCLIYYREKQTVSTTAATIVALCFLAVGCSAVLALCDIILWLDVAYLCSYVKMYGNVMLYLPQVYMNYKRRSTTGFSITGVIIDLLGGVFSMIQIFMDGYNYDDWKTIFENPTKFGIGIMTLCVSIVFIVQHYLLYPSPPPKSKLELKVLP